MLLENAPCVECIDKGLCFVLKHRNIIARAYWILLLKHSFVISQGQPCWHTFHALLSAKNKRQIKCVKQKLTPLYFHSSHVWYAWLLYYKIQQFFLEFIIMHEYNNNFAFPSYSSIYTAILNIHCFFFPLVYLEYVTQIQGYQWWIYRQDIERYRRTCLRGQTVWISESLTKNPSRNNIEISRL